MSNPCSHPCLRPVERIAVVLFLVLACAGARASPGPHWVIEVDAPDPGAPAALEAMGVSVSQYLDGGAEAYVDRDGLARIREAGFSYRILRRDGAAPFPPMKQGPGPDSLGVQYHNHEGVTAILHEYAAAYSHLTRLKSLGDSVEGRELWAMLLTADPGEKSAIPTVHYIATMHGDEPVGTELCLLFIDWLLGGYGEDSRITALLDDTALWILPLMNPDGLERRSRMNANGVDLNRDFPIYAEDFTSDFFAAGGTLDTAGRQPETVHVMEWSARHAFALTANFHTGALVVNYPYDYEPGVPSGVPAESPDEDLIRDLAIRYAMHNPPMSQSPAFPGGVVNGSAWFSIQGSMQDWQYRYMGAIETTLEVSNVKWPDASRLPGFWDDNRESMIAYLEGVHRGVGGVVTDARTDAPVLARVRVDGNPQPVFTDPDTGYYHRLLLPGEYGMTVSAPLYAPQRVEGVVVDGVSVGDTPQWDVELVFADANQDGQLNSVDIQLIINAVLGRPCPEGVICDLTGSGGADARDVQSVINAVLGAAS